MQAEADQVEADDHPDQEVEIAGEGGNSGHEEES